MVEEEVVYMKTIIEIECEEGDEELLNFVTSKIEEVIGKYDEEMLLTTTYFEEAGQ